MTAPGVVGRNGLLKGTDFLHFYTLGSLALEHRGADLYDMAAQSELGGATSARGRDALLRRAVRSAGVVAVRAFGCASLRSGAGLWLILSALLYGLCCYAIWRTCSNLQREGWLVLLLALAYPAFFHLMVWGQSSALALACFTGAYLALRADRKFLAGLAIGCLMIKPQLGLAAAFVFVAAREMRVVAGAIVSALANLLAGWAYYGTPVMQSYVAQLWHSPELMPQLEPRLYQTHSLRALWAMLLPWPSVAFWMYAASAVCCLVRNLSVLEERRVTEA